MKTVLGELSEQAKPLKLPSGNVALVYRGVLFLKDVLLGATSAVCLTSSVQNDAFAEFDFARLCSHSTCKSGTSWCSLEIK